MAGSNSQIGGGESSSKAVALSSLSESERLKLLVEAISDYAVYLLGPDGAVVSWNSGAETITGYRAVEAVGQNFSLLFSDEDRGAGVPAQLLKEASLVGRSESECWLLRKDGGRFLASTIVQPVPGDAGFPAGFAMVLRDVTGRAAAQEAVLEKERQFRLLVEGVADYSIYLLDPGGLIVNWNAGARRTMGYEAHEIVGQHFSRFYTKEDRTAGLPWRVLEIAAQEGRYESEGWRVRKDGSRFWASVVVNLIRDAKGASLGFAEITRDVSGGRAAQETLRESERQFRLLVEGVTDYALFMLDPNGVVTSWKRGAKRIKGYAAGEICRPALLPLLLRARQGGRRAGAGSADRSRRRTLRSGRLARPQERRALLGERYHTSHTETRTAALRASPRSPRTSRRSATRRLRCKRRRSIAGAPSGWKRWAI